MIPVEYYKFYETNRTVILSSSYLNSWKFLHPVILILLKSIVNDFTVYIINLLWYNNYNLFLSSYRYCVNFCSKNMHSLRYKYSFFLGVMVITVSLAKGLEELILFHYDTKNIISLLYKNFIKKNS